jgi:TonB family protein
MNGNYRVVFVRAVVGFLWLGVLSSVPTPSQNAETTATLKPVKKVVPEYPAVLKQMGVGGSVRMHVTVGADGNVESIEVRGGSAILAETAVKAVKQWKFASGGSKRTVDVIAEFECCNTVKMTP